jgi:hypothetical protein
MKREWPWPGSRLATVGHAKWRIQVPVYDDGPFEARFFPLEKENCRAVWDVVSSWRPDVIVLFLEHALPEIPSSLGPSLWVVVPTATVEGPGLRASWAACVEALRKGAPVAIWRLGPIDDVPRGAVVWGDLPPCVDAARIGPLRPERRGVCVAPWAAPPQVVREEVSDLCTVHVLGSSPEDGEGLVEEMREHGALLFWSKGRSTILERAPVLAMAGGLWVLTNKELPQQWGFELEDDYVVRPRVAEYIRAAHDYLRLDATSQLVRARAWQKIRESFDIRAVLDRALFFALREGDPFDGRGAGTYGS